MKYLTLLTFFLASFLPAQQSNTTTNGLFAVAPSTLVAGIPFGAPGPFTLNIGGGAGVLVGEILGNSPSYFQVWCNIGPPSPGSSNTPGGFIDLNFNTLFQTNPLFDGFLNTVPPSLYTRIFTAQYFSPDTFNFTCQAWITDPTLPAGHRWTAAINVVR